MIVGIIAPKASFAGLTPPGKNLERIDCPAGLGAFAITVRPPPVTAPATTAYLAEMEKSGTKVLQYVIAALSLKAVNKVAASIKGRSPREPKTGAIHQPCNPPWVTNPARKKPTSKGDLRFI